MNVDLKAVISILGMETFSYFNFYMIISDIKLCKYFAELKLISKFVHVMLFNIKVLELESYRMYKKTWPILFNNLLY